MIKQLLILDLNGVLCRKTKTDQLSNDNVIKLSNYNVVLRPGLYEFLNVCYQKYDVGFYTSTKRQNAVTILNGILTKFQQNETVCRLYREFTQLDPDYLIDPDTEKHDTIKLLSVIFNHPLINESRKYNYSNTIICDDSLTKLRFNNLENVIIIPTYTGNADDDVLYNLIYTISQKFDYLSNQSSIN